jgi:hypothetical protein
MSEQWLPSASDQEDMQHWSKESELLMGEPGAELTALRARVAELERELDASQTLLRKSCEDLRKRIDTVTAERDSWHADASSHLMALCEKQAEVNALKLTWTTARPTVEGYYWFREGPDDKNPWVVRVTELDMKMISGGQWAGPILGPEEAT